MAYDSMWAMSLPCPGIHSIDSFEAAQIGDLSGMDFSLNIQGYPSKSKSISDVYYFFTSFENKYI